MDFTEIYKQTSSLVQFSPGTHFLLTAIQDRLVVRRADSFQITRSWALDGTPSAIALALAQPPPTKAGIKTSQTAKSTSRLPSARGSTEAGPSSDGWITHIGWSCDSEYVLGACAKRGLVEVFKMRDEDWRARIEAGAEGLLKAEWAPDGRTVICWSEWGLRVTIWSLVTTTPVYIQYPTHPDRGYAFRSDGHYFVLAERHKSRDTLGIYDVTAAYRIVRHFPIPTSSAAGLALSPAGNHVAIWEGPLECKLYILNLAGDLLGSFSPDRDPGFGVRAVAWHPSGLFLAILGWDDKVHILDNLTYGTISMVELQSRIPSGATLWREPDKWLETTHGRGFLSYERVQSPYTLTLPSRDRSRPPPELSSSSKSTPEDEHLAWNTDGTLLLVRYWGAPDAVWLYTFPHTGTASLSDPSSTAKPEDGSSLKPKLRTALVHTSSVTAARWNPVRRGSLAVCTGGGALYLWSDEWVSEGGLRESGSSDGQPEEVAECVGVPAKKFSTNTVRWAPDGRGLILLDKETFCCAFEVEEADDPAVATT